jgi:hypothetical protein
MATMRNLGGGPPLLPVEEIDYVYSIPIKSIGQLWSIDIPLGKAVDPRNHVAQLHLDGGYYYSDSGNKYYLGYFVEIIDFDLIRLTIQGANLGYVRTDFHFPIGIYKFGVRPKHTEAAMYNWIVNGPSGSISLSRSFNISKTVLLNAGCTSRWHGYVKWQDSQTLSCNSYHCGAFVAEF